MNLNSAMSKSIKSCFSGVQSFMVAPRGYLKLRLGYLEPIYYVNTRSLI